MESLLYITILYKHSVTYVLLLILGAKEKITKRVPFFFWNFSKQTHRVLSTTFRSRGWDHPQKSSYVPTKDGAANSNFPNFTDTRLLNIPYPFVSRNRRRSLPHPHPPPPPPSTPTSPSPSAPFKAAFALTSRLSFISLFLHIMQIRVHNVSARIRLASAVLVY